MKKKKTIINNGLVTTSPDVLLARLQKEIKEKSDRRQELIEEKRKRDAKLYLDDTYDYSPTLVDFMQEIHAFFPERSSTEYEQFLRTAIKRYTNAWYYHIQHTDDKRGDAYGQIKDFIGRELSRLNQKDAPFSKFLLEEYRVSYDSIVQKLKTIKPAEIPIHLLALEDLKIINYPLAPGYQTDLFNALQLDIEYPNTLQALTQGLKRSFKERTAKSSKYISALETFKHLLLT